MKFSIGFVLAIFGLLFSQCAAAGRWSFSVNIGNPPPAVYVPYHSAYYVRPHMYAPPQPVVIYEMRPVYVQPPPPPVFYYYQAPVMLPPQHIYWQRPPGHRGHRHHW